MAIVVHAKEERRIEECAIKERK